MKRKNILKLSFLALALASCSSNNSETIINGSDYDYNQAIKVSDPSIITVEENTGEFLTQGGTYSLSGNLVGQILVEASESDEVNIELNGLSISNSSDSPIKALSANKVEISAKKDTGNTIYDKRNAKTTDTTTLGEGAIYAKTDLKIKGSGTLIVEGNYNNGIHTSKDLTIQKLTMKVTGYNNALKGNNSVEITSGEVQAYAKTGSGIKTEDSDLTSNGKQKGNIYLYGGNIYVDSRSDAIESSYNIEVDKSDSEVETNISIKSGKQSSLYSSSIKVNSEKGLKAQNDIVINKGTIVIASSDDAIHANYGETLGNGSKSTGNITINDGLIQVASGDDGLHSDNTLTVNGGKIVVTGASEGFEANYININGGYSYIYGSDDGVNCSKKSFSNCAFNMTGGYLDVAVKSGDTDGIDSNGNFTLSGGTIITRGSPGTGGGSMSTGLDCDGTCSMTGGTLISFNGLEKKPTTNSSIKYAGTTSSASQGGFGTRPGGNQSSSSKNLQAGNYLLSGDGISISFTNDYNYGSFLIYSSSLVSNASYSLKQGDSTLLSWSQSSSSVTIS